MSSFVSTTITSDSSITDAVVGSIFDRNTKHVVLVKGTTLEFHEYVHFGLRPGKSYPFGQEIIAICLVRHQQKETNDLVLQLSSGALILLTMTGGTIRPLLLMTASNNSFLSTGFLHWNSISNTVCALVMDNKNVVRFDFNVIPPSRRLSRLGYKDVVVRGVQCLSDGNVAVLLEQQSTSFLAILKFLQNEVVSSVVALPWVASGFMITPSGYPHLMLIGQLDCYMINSDSTSAFRIPVIPARDRTCTLRSGTVLEYNTVISRAIVSGCNGEQIKVTYRTEQRNNQELTETEYISLTAAAHKVLKLSTTEILVLSKTGDSGVYLLNFETPSLIRHQIFQNMGPVNDAAIVRAGQSSSLLLSTGRGLSSSIRRISNNFTLKDHFNHYAEEYVRMFPIRFASETENVIIVATTYSTRSYTIRILRNGEWNFLKLDHDIFSRDPTLAAGNIRSRSELSPIFQITNSQVIIAQLVEGRWIRNYEWHNIEHAHVEKTGEFAVFSTGSSVEVVIPKRREGQFYAERKSQTELDHPIIALDSIIENKDDTIVPYIIVAFKQYDSIHIYSAVNWNLRMQIRTPIMDITSMCVASKAIFITGNGGDLAYITDINLRERSQGSVRLDRTSLYGVVSTIGNEVFVSGQNSTIVSIKMNRVHFNKLGINSTSACTFYYQGPQTMCLIAISSNKRMLVVEVDRSIPTVPLMEYCTSMAYQDESNLLAVTLSRLEYGRFKDMITISQLPEANITKSALKNGRLPEHDCYPADESSSVLLFDASTLQPVHVHKFSLHEYVSSVVSFKCPLFETPFFCTSSHLYYPGQKDLRRGRLVIFRAVQFQDWSLDIVADFEFEGVPETVHCDNGVISVSTENTVHNFEIGKVAGKMVIAEKSKIQHEEKILNVETCGNNILVAGPSTSSEYVNNDDGELKQVGQGSIETSHLSLGDNFILGFSESAKKILLFHKPPPTSHTAVSQFSFKSDFYVGSTPSMVKSIPCVFKHKMLGKHQMIYGTMSGEIGLVLEVPSKWQTFLMEMTSRILNSERFREIFKLSMPMIDARNPPTRGDFIDGNVFESLLQMTAQDIQQCIHFDSVIQDDELPKSVEEFIQLLSELSQLLSVHSPVQFVRV